MSKFLLAIAIVPGLGALAWGQAELSDFPPGTTIMAWELTGEELKAAQTLSLEVTGLEGGVFRVRLSVEAEGSPEELGMLGFLGSAAFVQSAGAGVDLGALATLIKRRQQLKVGGEYALPGGVIFRVRETADIAGVQCLVGEYLAEDGQRVELGLALSDPVYFVPLLRVYRGEKVEFEMVLVEYRRP